MLSQTAEYALRAVVYLATRTGRPCTTEEVADRTRVPAAYLAKILQGLSKAGLVRSQRGVGGGVSLARRPAEVTLLDVVSAVEPIKRPRACPLGAGGLDAGLCRLHARVDEAMAAVEQTFADTTLAELLTDAEPLCARHRAAADTPVNGVEVLAGRLPLGAR